MVAVVGWVAVEFGRGRGSSQEPEFNFGSSVNTIEKNNYY